MTLIDERPAGTMAPFRAWRLIGAFDFDEAEEDWKAAFGEDGFAAKPDAPMVRVLVVHLPNYREADVIEDGVIKRVERWALRVDMDDLR
jgi:hypothetical protein